MLPRPLAALAAVVLLAPLTLAAASAGGCRGLAGAGTSTDPVEVCASTGWFEPAGDTRIGNVGGLAAVAGQSEPGLPTWGPQPPEDSVTEGAGAVHVAHAGTAELGDTAQGVVGARFEGTITGNVDRLALDVYMVTTHEYDEYLPGSQAAVSGACAMGSCGGTYPVLLSLQIDDRHVDLGEVATYLYPPSTSGNTAALRFRVAVTGLFDGVDDPDARYEVTIAFHPHEDEATILFDAVEWPSRILFNPDDLTSYKVVDVRDAAHDHEH